MRVPTTCSLGLIISIALSPESLATNGYFTHGLGVKNKGMAGAGTALPNEAIAASINPASTAFVDNHFEFGLGLFSPRRSYTASSSLANGQGGAFTIAPGTVNSDSEYFLIPYIAYTWERTDTTAFGISFYGRGGMNTDYKTGSAIFDPDGLGAAAVMTLPGSYGAGDAGVDLTQAFLDLSYAWQSGDWSWGAALVLSGQAFEGKGFASFAPYTETFAASGGTKMPSNLSNNDRDYSFGAGLKGGVIWEASDKINLAMSYQSKIYMSELDDYSDLFAEQGDFDIPASIRAGISFKLPNNSAFHYDIEHTMFSSVNSVGNPIQHIFSCPTVGGTSLTSCLGGSNGAGFGWNDMSTHKLGYEWQLRSAPNWTFRAGFSHGAQPIDSDQVLFNMMAPGVIQNHITAGLTHRLSSGREYSLSLMYAPEKSVQGLNSFDPTQTIELKMHQFEIEFGYSW
jgi:long-chain fatty acid transport protein